MTIQFKRLINAGAEPTTSQLKVGEIAINLPDETIFTKDNNNKIISIGGGSSVKYGIVSANTQAEASKGYLVETSRGVFTITLPSKTGLKDGRTVGIGDLDGLAHQNNITITADDKIMGLDEDFILDIDYAVLTLTYITGYGWRITAGAGESAPPSFVSVDDVFENVKGQTKFTPSGDYKFVAGCDVYYNSGRLIADKGYTINSDGSISLKTPVTSDKDIIVLRIYNRVEVFDTAPLQAQIDANKADIVDTQQQLQVVASDVNALKPYVGKLYDHSYSISTTSTAQWYRICEISRFYQGGSKAYFKIVASNGYNYGTEQGIILEGTVNTGSSSPYGTDGQFTFLKHSANSFICSMCLTWLSENNTYELWAYLPAYSANTMVFLYTPANNDVNTTEKYQPTKPSQGTVRDLAKLTFF